MNKFYRYFRRVFQGFELTRETPDLCELEGDEAQVEECSPTLSRVVVSGDKEQEENP
jgi:hypothetical protein